MDKKSLSERDIGSKYIAPAVQQAGWDMHKQVREEVSFTKGRIIVRGKLHSRGEARRAELTLDQFPSPAELWQRYCQWKGLANTVQHKIEAPNYDDGSGRMPRYYQMNAINRTVEAVARDQDRILLVMATGTGKTYTAFQKGQPYAHKNANLDGRWATQPVA